MVSRDTVQAGYKVLLKKVLKFSGQPEELLKGLTSNDFKSTTNAFLDRMGKIVVFAHQLHRRDEIYMVIEEQFEERLLEHLHIYLKLSKTQLTSTPLKAIHVVGPTPTRAPDLTIPMRVGTMYLVESASLFSEMQEISEEDYERLRLEHGISVQGKEFDRELLLETDRDDAVSYTKGCYLGQEIICRVHNLGKPAKKLVRMRFDSPPKEVTANSDVVGEVRTSSKARSGNHWISYVMLRRHTGELDAGHIMDDGVSMRAQTGLNVI